jgi:hypothetical protein
MLQAVMVLIRYRNNCNIYWSLWASKLSSLYSVGLVQMTLHIVLYSSQKNMQTVMHYVIQTLKNITVCVFSALVI